MAAAGPVILLISLLLGLTLCSLVFVPSVAHYFLCTIIDTTSGNDEVHFPSESFIDWWWKPILCGWVLSFCVLSGGIFLSPLAFSPKAFTVALVVWVWFLFPFAILSVLFTSNWFFFLHPVLIWRMLKHVGPFAYVHVMTLISSALGIGLIFAALTYGLYWIVPAALIAPMTLLFYARHWGRMAWLSAHFVPRSGAGVNAKEEEDDVPELAVQEVEEGMREGLPPKYTPPGAIKSDTMPLAEEEDEWDTDKKPYGIVGEAPLEAPAPSPAPSAAAQSQPQPVGNEEEDEWSTDKSPYDTSETVKTKTPMSQADKPTSYSEYYEQRHKREKAQQARHKRQTEQTSLPPLRKNTPRFAKVMLAGVWPFLAHSVTMRVWANMAVLMFVELFLASMVLRVLAML
jgi:hypothetical protein